MAYFSGKHLVEEIDGVRCSVVEKNVSRERMEFLKKLLELNNYEVKVEEVKEEDGTVKYNVGVTDIVFNPTIEVFKRKLRSFSGKRVTPAYWLQLSDAETEKEVHYWEK